MKDAKELKKAFVHPDEVRAAVLACMDSLETQLPKGVVITGSTTFLLEGGVSFKIEEETEVEESQNLNCRDIVLAVLGHIYLWKTRGVGMEDPLSYAGMRDRFADRMKLPSVNDLLGVSMKLEHNTEAMERWDSEHEKAPTFAEIKIELPALLCNEHHKRLHN
ncbi:fungal specific transcription factor domain-containing protein [Colletotrichum acutatum]